MVDWKWVIGIPVIVIGIIFLCIWADNQRDMKAMLKQEECEKFGMDYLYNSQKVPKGEYCAKDNELYPVHMKCKKTGGMYDCEMFFIRGWNKLVKRVN